MPAIISPSDSVSAEIKAFADAGNVPVLKWELWPYYIYTWSTSWVYTFSMVWIDESTLDVICVQRRMTYSWWTYTWDMDTSELQQKLTAGTWISISNWVISSTVDWWNTKTFYLASTSDLTNAQAAYDWYAGWKNPIIIYNWDAYLIRLWTSNSIYFYAPEVKTNVGASQNQTYQKMIVITASQWTVTTVEQNYNRQSPTLSTTINYSSPYTPLYDWSPATKKYVDDNAKTYNAWTGISIWSATKNWRKWPAPDGFHVPSKDEWVALCWILTTTFSMASNATTMATYLKMAMAGRRGYFNSYVAGQGTNGYYWSSSPYPSEATDSYNINFSSSKISPQLSSYRSVGLSVRCFKDSPVIPDSSWTTLYDWSSIATDAWVFYNSTLWLISVSWDWTTWYTIKDKNEWATTVYNSWDTLSESNCWYYYQRWNNYWFAWTWNITTSSTQVDASSYWPNTANGYYSDSTFITWSEDWSSTSNDDLWWDTTWTYTINNIINNTWVLSVNGQTGNVTLSGWDMSYSDFWWQTKTWATITLDLASTYEPSADFILQILMVQV